MDIIAIGVWVVCEECGQHQSFKVEPATQTKTKCVRCDIPLLVYGSASVIKDVVGANTQIE